MDKTVRLRVRKELEKAQERKIISLKGSLISGGYTDIIHIDDEDEQYHINFFSTERKVEALMLIQDFIEKNAFTDIVELQ